MSALAQNTDRALLAASLALGPLALGGVTPETRALILLAQGVVLLALLRGRSVRLRVGWAGVALGVAAFYLLVQLVPLPREVVAWLAPRVADAHEGVAWALEVPTPRWIALTTSPLATERYLLESVGLGASFLSGLWVAQRHRSSTVAEAVVLAAVVVGLVAMAHWVVGARVLYGVYAPRFAGPRLLSPLLNENHFGDLMVASAGLAFALNREHSKWLTAATGVLLAGTIGSLSRTAILVAPLVLAAVYWTVHRRPAPARGSNDGGWARRRNHRQLGLLLAIALLAAGGVARSAPLLAEFQRPDWDKLEHIAGAAPIVLEAPIFGVGRGAFERRHPAITESDEHATHAESVLVELPSELGWPVAAFLLVVFARVLRVALRSPRHRALGAFLAIFGVLQLVDFAYELPGVLAFGAAGLAAVDFKRRWTLPSWVGYAVASAAVVAAVVVWDLDGRLDARRAIDRAEDSLAAERPAAALADLVAVLPRDPHHPGLLAVAAEAARREGADALALRFASRAMWAAPGWPAPHLSAGLVLMKAGAVDQGLLEFRIAEELRAGASRAVICHALRRGASAELALDAAPRDAPRAFLAAVGACANAEGLRLIDARIEELGGTPEQRRRALARALSAGDFERAALVIADLPREEQLEARVRIALQRGAPEEAERLLEQSEAGPELRLRVAVARGDTDDVARQVMALRVRGLTPAERERRELRIASAYAGVHDIPRQLDALWRAHRARGALDPLETILELARDHPLSLAQRQLARRRLCASRPRSAHCRMIGRAE